MTAPQRRRAFRWTMVLATLLTGGGAVLVLMPDAIDAQVRAVPLADEIALNESKAALNAVRSQVAATSGLPPDATRLTARISAAVQAQEREVLNGNEAAARKRHEEAAQALKRLGALLQRHLAPPGAIQVDMAALEVHFGRLSERHRLLEGLAAESPRSLFDVEVVVLAEGAARSALNSGSIDTARTSLDAYLAAIEGLEDALFLRSQKLVP